jgi:hypothetical protein
MMRPYLSALLFCSAAVSAAAHASPWGVFDEIANREWTTDKEPRPRVTKFHWVEPDRVLEARHGFVSRLQFGEDKFADTVERLVLNPKTGKIDVTYSYEDGRPPLKAVIEIEDDGTAVETFTDASGAQKRNIYKSPSLSVNAIERQEMKNGVWATLGTTSKVGLTQAEIAENARRAEQARQRAIAQENARIAAEAARQRRAEAEREAEENRRYAEQQAEQQQQSQMMNPLQVLQGMAATINAQNRSNNSSYGNSSGGSSYGASSSTSSSSDGAIIVSDGSEDYRKAQEEEQAMRARLEEQHRQEDAAAQAAAAESARQQAERDANAKDCWGRPITAGSSSSSSSGDSPSVCPQ